MIDAWYRENPFAYVPKDERYLPGHSDNISTLGNISRGVGFGNRQDVTVNSNLNLRLSGTLQNKVEVLAAISDNNSPIQPEGNTQQIQDFDRVFIQISIDSLRATAGDFLMTTPMNSYFMNYNKKSRGLQAQYVEHGKRGTWYLNGEGAISRGRFSRNTIAGIEGNQGPYRLKGSNGETFIIIISGTEQVYLDGQLLTRGEQNDYTIDYNTGELTFMPSRLITQYSRIVVEFQYSDRNYARSVFRTGTAFQTDRWTFRANYYREQDNRNQPNQIDLDRYDSTSQTSARQVLADAGDAEYAFIYRIDSIQAFDPTIIQYYKTDSNGFDAYVFAEKNDTTKRYFQLSFSYVGANNGNYVQKLSNANGKVFQWVEPVSGIPQGDYEPVEVLIPPKSLQMVNVGFDYKINQNTTSSIEVATSNNDLNTLSTLDKEDDVGYALKYGLQNNSKLLPMKLNDWRVISDVSYEHTQANFRYVQRYRSVEFDRQWNRTLENPGGIQGGQDEHIAIAGFTIRKGNAFQLHTGNTYYKKGANLGGLANSFDASLRLKKFRSLALYERVNSKVPMEEEVFDNRFTRMSAEVQRTGKNFYSLVRWSSEASAFGNLGDTLFAQSYKFELRQMEFGNGDSTNFMWMINANQRLDEKGGEGGAFKPTTDGRDASMKFGLPNLRGGSMFFTGTYRELQYVDSASPAEQTMQGRWELRMDFLKRTLRTQTYYQVGTGQEQKREFSYLKVGDGLGAYIWNDYDSNGIQSLNEFEIASTYDQGRANYIRQYLPVQGFIKSYSSEFNHNLRIQPAAVWKQSKSKLKKTVARFSNISSLKVAKKVTSNEADIFLNPVLMNVDDSLLLSTSAALRSVFSFNQASPVFGVDYQWYRNNGKQLLVNGIDTRVTEENSLKVRYSPSKSWALNITSTSGDRSYISAFLTTRSYDYHFVSMKPQLDYIYGKNLRTSLYFEYFEAHNQKLYGGEKTFNHDLTSELRWNLLNRGIVRIALGLVDVNYKGNDNSPVAYELLSGLKNGRNAKWSLQVEQRFSNSIQLQISYDGRKSLENKVIHIGRVQARYLF